MEIRYPDVTEQGRDHISKGQNNPARATPAGVQHNRRGKTPPAEGSFVIARADSKQRFSNTPSKPGASQLWLVNRRYSLAWQALRHAVSAI